MPYDQTGDLLQLLDDVSAIAQNVLPLAKDTMSPEEYRRRREIINACRKVCDDVLRGGR